MAFFFFFIIDISFSIFFFHCIFISSSYHYRLHIDVISLIHFFDIDTIDIFIFIIDIISHYYYAIFFFDIFIIEYRQLDIFFAFHASFTFSQLVLRYQYFFIIISPLAFAIID